MNDNKLFVPISIVVAGLIIAGAVFFTRDNGNANPQVNNQNDKENTQQAAVDPVTDKDHILGNPDAEIVIVEYSDFECPFCARFHPTMEQIMNEYGNDGKVAWVYRHFPLDQIHKSARTASEASECVAELGGNQSFWDYSKKLFESTPSSLSIENLKANAIAVGINEADYQSCVDSGRHKATVEANYQSGLVLAKSDRSFGTPYSVIVSKKDGTQVTIPGAQSYSVLKQTIDSILSGN